MLCRTIFLWLLLVVSTIVAAPMNNEWSSHHHTINELSTNHQVSHHASPSEHQVIPQEHYPAHQLDFDNGWRSTRLYQHAKKMLDRKQMTREEWEELRNQSPLLARQIEEDFQKRKTHASLKTYYRDLIRKYPDDSELIMTALNKGLTMEDLLRGGQDESPRAVQKRKDIRSRLSKLRKEIADIGTDKIPKGEYLTRTRSVKPEDGVTDEEDGNESHESGKPIKVEDETLQAIKVFRSVLRNNPYDPLLVSLRENLHRLMKLSLRQFHPIDLPEQPPYVHQSGYLHRPYPVEDGASSSASLIESDHSKFAAPHLSGNLIQYQNHTPEERSRFIESLFDPSDLYRQHHEEQHARDD